MDSKMQQIGEAVARDYSGDRETARRRLQELWDEIHLDGDALQRCTLAHYMADMQEDPQQELWWDLRALEAASSMDDASITYYIPSLHLNLAEDYRKLSDLSKAREHLTCASQFACALPENGYGNMIRRGIAALSNELSPGATAQ